MKDSVILGTGNSRYLKSVADFKTLYPTYDDFAAALVTGTLPIDLNGINAAGFQQIGDALGMHTLLKSSTAQKHGRDDSALPDDMWADLVPVGGILWYAKDGIPDGYLKCDGSAIGRTDYDRLFSIIGTVFGSGDGSTTFLLPNLSAKFIRGSGNYGSYATTFGNTQEATCLNSQEPSGFYGTTNADIETYSEPMQSGTYYRGDTGRKRYSFVRPLNIALTPIIKY